MQLKMRKRGHVQRGKGLGDGSILDPVLTIRIQQERFHFGVDFDNVELLSPQS